MKWIGNTGGTGFRVEGGEKLSFKHTACEMFTEHLGGAHKATDVDLDTYREGVLWDKVLELAVYR